MVKMNLLYALLWVSAILTFTYASIMLFWITDKGFVCQYISIFSTPGAILGALGIIIFLIEDGFSVFINSKHRNTLFPLCLMGVMVIFGMQQHSLLLLQNDHPIKQLIIFEVSEKSFLRESWFAFVLFGAYFLILWSMKTIMLIDRQEMISNSTLIQVETIQH